MYKVLQFYNFDTFNTFFGKLLTVLPKMGPFWLHVQQYNAVYLWLYMYTPDDGQPRPEHVVFNIINWLIYSIQSRIYIYVCVMELNKSIRIFCCMMA
jgi:hypothetical protein